MDSPMQLVGQVDEITWPEWASRRVRADAFAQQPFRRTWCNPLHRWWTQRGAVEVKLVLGAVPDFARYDALVGLVIRPTRPGSVVLQAVAFMLTATATVRLAQKGRVVGARGCTSGCARWMP
jgi:hypothetical protein